MKRFLYFAVILGIAASAQFLALATAPRALADNCYDSGPTYVCTGGQQYSCMTTKCCTTKYVSRHKADGTLEFVPQETCRVTNTSCRPNGESCQR